MIERIALARAGAEPLGYRLRIVADPEPNAAYCLRWRTVWRCFERVCPGRRLRYAVRVASAVRTRIALPDEDSVDIVSHATNTASSRCTPFIVASRCSRPCGKRSRAGIGDEQLLPAVRVRQLDVEEVRASIPTSVLSPMSIHRKSYAGPAQAVEMECPTTLLGTRPSGVQPRAA